MRKQSRNLVRVLLIYVSFVGAYVFAQDETAKIIDQGVMRIEENRQAQKSVDAKHSARLLLIEKFEETMKVVEGLDVYNDMMKRQVDRQYKEMDQLRTSITDVSIIERQILPLLSRMLDGLEAFIQLDIPFLLEERNTRVEKLRGVLERVDVTVAEKTRRVFEAYQIETEYGRTIEAYRSKLVLPQATWDVDFLRIGRTAFLYRSVGSQALGLWNKNTKQWESIEGREYRRHFEDALKVARQEKSPDLITLPLIVDSGE